jgi:hypothetical protein
MASQQNPLPTAPDANNTLLNQNQVASSTNPGAAAASNRVVVNLHANISVSGNVDIISSSGETLYDVVVCAVDLSASALYTDASSGVIEFWEVSGGRAAIEACISAADANFPASDSARLDGRGFDAHAADLTSELGNVINGRQNASAAAPFNGDRYNDPEYQNFASFGDLVLGLYAHHLFGHVAATAAIDNDAALVAYMNSDAAGDAQIPTNLVTALRGITSSVAKAIASQVLSQDPGRASAVDNNQAQNNNHQALLFAPGDTVYVQVQVLAPTLSVNRTPLRDAPGTDATNKPGASGLPPQTATNDSSADGAPLGASEANNLINSAYPSTAPVFALQIRLK